jgi:hypothetical protein
MALCVRTAVLGPSHNRCRPVAAVGGPALTAGLWAVASLAPNLALYVYTDLRGASGRLLRLAVHPHEVHELGRRVANHQALYVF